MPLGTRMWSFTKDVVRLERDEYGVYELLDSLRNIVYIGYGKVECSLLEHFSDGTHPIPCVHHFSIEYTWSEQKAKERWVEELDKFFKMHNRKPSYNV